MKKKRSLVIVVAMLCVISSMVGGTLAWLIDSTDSVVNTFTTSDVDIELSENTGETYQILPGVDLAKDPKVTVKADSVACFVFIKVEETNWPTPVETVDGNAVRKVNYEIAENWTALNGETGVYYLELTSDVEEDTDYYVLDNNVVTVSESLTKGEMDAITVNPKLKITAYACQRQNGNETYFTAAEAWTAINNN